MGLTFLLSAGGTGGHLFPAQALASELTRRGHDVELATDHRVGEIGQDFPARRTHVIASATLAGKSPVALARTAWKLGCGTLQARSLLRSLKPDAVVGFGGYPTFPPMLAAWLTGTPSVLHEANAVMGRANRMLAARASAIATSFPLAARPDPAIAARMVRTGNPVRDAVIAAAAPYREPQPEGGSICSCLAVRRARASFRMRCLRPSSAWMAICGGGYGSFSSAGRKTSSG